MNRFPHQELSTSEIPCLCLRVSIPNESNSSTYGTGALKVAARYKAILVNVIVSSLNLVPSICTAH